MLGMTHSVLTSEAEITPLRLQVTDSHIQQWWLESNITLEKEGPAGLVLGGCCGSLTSKQRESAEPSE